MDIDRLMKLSSAELAGERLTEDEMRKVQAAVRAEGRCGSLQTFHGTPCRKFPPTGYTVCERHGSNAPQTVAKAERLLAVARMPAIAWILEALEQSHAPTCSACGFPKHSLKEQRRMDALAFRLLDRTGFGPHSKVDIRHGAADEGMDVLIESMTDEERSALGTLLAQIDALKARVRYRVAQGVVAPPTPAVAALPTSSVEDQAVPVHAVSRSLASALDAEVLNDAQDVTK